MVLIVCTASSEYMTTPLSGKIIIKSMLAVNTYNKTVVATCTVLNNIIVGKYSHNIVIGINFAIDIEAITT